MRATIICGTDLSESAREATRAAAAIARRLDADLVLVHAIDELGAAAALADRGDPLYDDARRALEDEAARVRALTGHRVEAHTVAGAPSRVLCELAARAHAALVVVGAVGQAKARWLLGSTAEKVARSASAPTLIVRDGAPLEAWGRGDRPLRVMVGVELASTSRAALRWAASLAAVGGAELTVVQVVWPPAEQLRLGKPLPLGEELPDDVRDALLRDLRGWVGETAPADAALRVSPGWGRVAAHLGALADEDKADLLVVGSRQRTGFDRLWHGSTARGVIERTRRNVVCVPRGELAEVAPDVPAFRSVLVATDLSPGSARAVPVAYGMVEPGGVVHLLHVAPLDRTADLADPTTTLAALEPPGQRARDVHTSVAVERDDDVAAAILRVAARLGVDAICMGTRGRSAITAALLGSVARDVVARARTPVTLVPPEPEE